MPAGEETKVLVFGSLKGGVGKTTLSMLAAEALVAEARPVVLIDADTVGTEASEFIGTKSSPYTLSSVSLIDVFGRVPDHESVTLWLEQNLGPVLARLRKSGRKRLLVPTFGEMKERDRPPWREVLERSGLYVQRRLRDLIRVCREAGFDVVVDLPAFDVGLAKEARQALASEGIMFFVTDVDARSINATLFHLRILDEDKKKHDENKADPQPATSATRAPSRSGAVRQVMNSGRPPLANGERMTQPSRTSRLAINRIPSSHMHEIPPNFIPSTPLVRVPLDETVLSNTRHETYGGNSGQGLIKTLTTLLERLDIDDRRYLRGER